MLTESFWLVLSRVTAVQYSVAIAAEQLVHRPVGGFGVLISYAVIPAGLVQL